MRQVSPGRRAAEYWFIDGLPELVFGVALLVYGAIPIAIDALHLGPVKPAEVCLILLFLVLYIWDRRIIGALKARLTYPRTGYVRPPGDPVALPDDSIVLLMTDQAPAQRGEENVTWFRNRTVLVFWICSLLLQQFPGSWSPTIAIAAVAAQLYALNRGLEHPYSLWSVIALACAGLAVHWIPVSPKGQPFLVLVIGGGWLLIRGLWTLWHYLRVNPLPQRAEVLSLE